MIAVRPRAVDQFPQFPNACGAVPRADSEEVSCRNRRHVSVRDVGDENTVEQVFTSMQLDSKLPPMRNADVRVPADLQRSDR